MKRSRQLSEYMQEMLAQWKAERDALENRYLALVPISTVVELELVKRMTNLELETLVHKVENKFK